jgi:glycosyltransferase involved in cell wall biosynthesis
MNISVVIGTFNQKEVLKKTLLSLFNQTLFPELYEIQLVDSSSKDGTDQMVEDLEPTCLFNYLRVENRGKSAARNAGIRAAKGEIIFFTDADMVADPRLLEEHLQAHEKKKNASFEGLTINPDGKPYIRANLAAGKKIKWAYFLSGNLSVNKKQLLEAGLFDENFKGYGWEDLELGYRFHQMRIPLYYLPSAVNHHHHPVSSQAMAERKYEMGRSAALFYKKHPAFEIKMFLGMNPVAMGVYQMVKSRPSLLKIIGQKAPHSPFYRYLLEEYQYRLGLEEGLSNQ